MPSNVKTFDGSEDLEDHLKIFQGAAKVERWAMPTWCHMFKFMLNGSARARKLSHVIKELKQGGGKDQPKAAKKEEASAKDKALVILMVQPWQRMARQRVTQSFSPDLKISFPPLRDEDETKGRMSRDKGSLHTSHICRRGVGFRYTIRALLQQALSRGEMSNDSGHRTPHWFQRRSRMANRKNITNGKNRGYGTFNFYMDELCGAKHRLNVHKGCPPVRHKKRSQAPERNKAIQEEVEKLIEVGIMKEVHYHS
nr:reverse transcriptase domain-containing protein [Tanacetum cinerariifolium]